ncbi:hypothetical protein [Amycolatopsis sp. H20-H5]|uniref:hypothetical protein n=1 Tax=Amycolatopsis sp. H20-H5 TaxID=3046309 RepID=UPI002DBEFF37|nr:hypothetical protein [Amycolatopsis sp. H20-H5]MEC3974725.1 hypothetical protein [Amycolatopsis sp. H20-H5]
MSEQEYHPADPHFNPAHPDHEAWRSGPQSPDMPAEAGIVAMFTDPTGPIQASDVRLDEPTGPEEKPATAKSRSK